MTRPSSSAPTPPATSTASSRSRRGCSARTRTPAWPRSPPPPGVSRATVYRHFPTREALVEAIQAQAVEDARAGAGRLPARRGQRHRRAAPAVRRVAGRRRALRARRARPGRRRRDARAPAPRPRRAAARADRARPGGRRVLPRAAAGVVARAFGALLLAGARAVADGTLTRDEAPTPSSAPSIEGLRA